MLSKLHLHWFHKFFAVVSQNHDVIQYITSPGKPCPDGVIDGAVSPETAVEEMETVIQAFHKEKGVKLRHSVLSFAPKEPVTPRQVKEIARECIRYYEEDYQILAAVHEDRNHLHVHFVMNTTSYRNGHKYHGDKADYYGFLAHMNRATKSYGSYVKAEK